MKVSSEIRRKVLSLEELYRQMIPPSLLKECKTLQNISLHGKSHINGSASTGSGVGVDTAYLRYGYAVSSLMDTAYWLSE
ncbi:hypothetical protein Tco_0733913 [Tanacetum coccineum]